MSVADTAEVDLGDRTLRFTAHGPAHTTSDLSMRDSLSGLLFRRTCSSWSGSPPSTAASRAG